MPGIEKDVRYDSRTATFNNATGDGTTAADTDLVVIEVDHKSQLSTIHISGSARNLYEVVVRDQDATNSQTIKSLAVQDTNLGDFEFPFIRNIGAQKEVAVVNKTQLSDAEYAVNIEVDELRRRD